MNINPSPQKPQKPQKPLPNKPANNWTWWIIFLSLLAWNFLIFIPNLKKVETVKLPYSTFIDQVRNDNVASVKIVGASIKGNLLQPIAWPIATPGKETKTTKTPATTPSPTPTPLTYSEFETTFPEAVGDTRLISMLEEHGVEIDVIQPSSPWLSTLLVEGLPLVLLIGFFLWMGRQGGLGGQGSKLFGFGRSKARLYNKEESGVTFDDIAGADEVKRELQEVVDFLRSPQKYHDLGARIPRGVLLVGPPGTGKTLTARAVAGEAGVPFFSISASEFVEMFVGVGASRVRDLFQQAKEAAPAIIFIDELDAVGRRRGAGMGSVNDEREQTLNQLLVEMDGFDERHEIIVMAATNRPDVLDPALLRPGRFDRQVTLGLPDMRGREGILRIHTRKLKLAGDVDLHTLAAATPGFSGADIANLCNEAALVAARNNHTTIQMSDFEEAEDQVILGGARSLLLDEHDRNVIAYHESGHTLVAWFSPEADPVLKVSIIPRGQALGVTEQLPEKDQYNISRRYLLARLSVMLGGRTAEELAFGDITTGAENDLVEATKLARRMVTRWGMSELGLVAFQANEEQPFLGYEMATGRDYSEDTAARIDQLIHKLLDDRHEDARKTLSEHRTLLDQLAQALLKHETIQKQDLEKILGPRPTPG